MNSKTNIENISVAGELRNESNIPYVAGSMDKMGVRCLSTYRRWKSILDRVLALFAIVIISPLLALIAVAIKLDSPGYIIFSQERVGEGRRRFILYKFRSMYINHDDSKYWEFLRKYMTENWSCRTDQNGQDVFQLIRDPRITRVGAILRKTNLDELPQLFNVLKGEMSFVGPRPDIPFSVTMYQSHHFKRFDITPGITGLWQISGRKNLSFEDMVRLDFEYMKKQSLFLDIKIIFLTIGAILGKHPS